MTSPIEKKIDDWQKIVNKPVFTRDGKDIGVVESIQEEKTLKFKAIRMSIEELGKMLDEDPDIQYVTGSATLTPTDSYSI
jgi:sporulation protein YlmC with PRC-barrel domain